MRHFLAGLWLLFLSGCGIQGALPPIAIGGPAPSAEDLLPELPAPRRFEHHLRIVSERDSANGYTRIALTTNPGRHFLWIHRPRVTFFFVEVNGHPAVPSAVSVVIQAVSPQVFVNNRLTLICDGAPTEEAGTPLSVVTPRAFVTSHYLAFDIPIDDFARLLGCQSATVRAGGVEAVLGAGQLEALRDLASRMTPSLALDGPQLHTLKLRWPLDM